MRIFNFVNAALVTWVLVGCDGDARPFQEVVEVRTENLISIDVVPPTLTVPTLIMNIGESVQFGVQGTSVIGQTVTLSSSDRNWQVTKESVASINSDGLLVAKANGDVDVLISIGGMISTAYALKVSDQPLTGVQAIVGESIVERCLPENYQATGLFGDGTIRDLAGVDWTLAEADAGNARWQNNPDTTVAVTGLNSGAITLTATLGDFSASMPIEISDSLMALEISPDTGSVDVGDITTYAAFGEYTDAASAPGADDTAAILRTENVTASVDWEIASGSSFATVTNSVDSRGEVTGMAAGSATLLASCGNLNSLPIQVVVSASSDDGSDSLSFLRDSVSLVVNNSTTLSVSTGSSYSSANVLDNEDLTWKLSVDNTLNPAVELDGSGTNAGKVTARAVGGATITVTDNDGASGSIRVEVTSN